MITKSDPKAEPLWKTNAVVKYRNMVALQEAQAREQVRKDAEEKQKECEDVAARFTAQLYALGIDRRVGAWEVGDPKSVRVVIDDYTFVLANKGALYLEQTCEGCGHEGLGYIPMSSTAKLGEYLSAIEDGKFLCETCVKAQKEVGA